MKPTVTTEFVSVSVFLPCALPVVCIEHCSWDGGHPHSSFDVVQCIYMMNVVRRN